MKKYRNLYPSQWQFRDAEQTRYEEDVNENGCKLSLEEWIINRRDLAKWVHWRDVTGQQMSWYETWELTEYAIWFMEWYNDLIDSIHEVRRDWDFNIIEASDTARELVKEEEELQRRYGEMS